MNYYRRYVGDYLRDTPRLTILQHGAYTLMLDYYYADEKPLPLDREELYLLLRAMRPEDREAVDKVVDTYFTRHADGFHNKRADEEIHASQSARTNGGKGGRPRREETDHETGEITGKETGGRTNTGTETATQNITGSGHPPTTNHQPPSPNLQPSQKQRSPGVAISPGEATSIGAAAREALTLAEAKIGGGEDTPAATLASVLLANGCTGNAFHPLVFEWAREGVTVERLKRAIATARQRPGKETGKIGPAYLDPIVHDETKPAAEVHQERASKAAEKRAAETQRTIAEQRKGARSAMPEHVRHAVNGLTKPRQWWETPAGRAAKGREQDIERGAGEDEAIFAARLFARMGPGPWLEGITGVQQRMVDQFSAKAPGQ